MTYVLVLTLTPKCVHFLTFSLAHQRHSICSVYIVCTIVKIYGELSSVELAGSSASPLHAATNCYNSIFTKAERGVKCPPLFGTCPAIFLPPPFVIQTSLLTCLKMLCFWVMKVKAMWGACLPLPPPLIQSLVKTLLQV